MRFLNARMGVVVCNCFAGAFLQHPYIAENCRPWATLSLNPIILGSGVSAQYWPVTDRQTDGQTPHDSTYRAMQSENVARMKSIQHLGT